MILLDLGNVGIPFSKMMSREAANRKKYAQMSEINTDSVNKVLDKLSTAKRVITPDFNLFKSRYIQKQQLPAFMQNLHNRMSITGLSFEMLKANNYTEIELPGTGTSSLEPRKSFHVDKRSITTASSPFFKTYTSNGNHPQNNINSEERKRIQNGIYFEQCMMN